MSQEMTPSQLATFLAAAIPAKLNVLVEGEPGIGKSEITQQAATACDADILVNTPAVEDPTVPAGLPWADAKDEFAHFKPFGNLYKAMKAKKLTVWDLEDFGQAPNLVQAGYMQLLLAGEVNGHKISKHVTFVATTNGRTHRAGVGGILEPVKSRFAAIIKLVVSLNDWVQWALTKPYIPADLIAFHRFREQDGLLCKFNPSADLVNCPLPRTWAHVGKLIQLQLPAEIESAAVAGAVGEGAATEYLGFRRMWKELPSIEGILMNPDQAPVPTNLAALFATATGLAALASDTNFGAVAKYVTRMNDAGRGDFAALCVRDASRRSPTLQQTPDFVRLMAGPIGELVSGRAARAA